MAGITYEKKKIPSRLISIEIRIHGRVVSDLVERNPLGLEVFSH